MPVATASRGRRLAVAVRDILEQRELERESVPEVAPEDRLVLNVGGVRHETLLSSLLRKPGTRLYYVARLARRAGLREVYFDRNPDLFSYILNYYRTDTLHMPTNVCGPMLQAELTFWQLDEKDVAECCWVAYNSYADTLGMLAKFEADDSLRYQPTCSPHSRSCLQALRPRVWTWLQNPYSSTGAKVYAFLSLIMVCISITVFVIETLPYFGAIFSRTSGLKFNSSLSNEELRRELDILNNVSPYHILLLIDNSCNLFFMAEFLVKLFAAPSRGRFLALPLSVLELLALIPYYLATAIVFLHSDPVSCFRFIQVLLAFRLVRIFRIFALMKHFLALKILVYTMVASAKELFLVVLIVLIGLIIFACLEYYMELLAGNESDFEHIPLAFWWALVTMTTVGYGDVVPKSGPGLVVGGLCAISGVLVIALSVPVIVNNFTLYYTHAQSRAKLRERRRQHSLVKHWQSLTKNVMPAGKKRASREADGDKDKGPPSPRETTPALGNGAASNSKPQPCRLRVEDAKGGKPDLSGDEEGTSSLPCSLNSSMTRLLPPPSSPLPEPRSVSTISLSQHPDTNSLTPSSSIPHIHSASASQPPSPTISPSTFTDIGNIPLTTIAHTHSPARSRTPSSTVSHTPCTASSLIPSTTVPSPPFTTTTQTPSSTVRNSHCTAISSISSSPVHHTHYTDPSHIPSSIISHSHCTANSRISSSTTPNIHCTANTHTSSSNTHHCHCKATSHAPFVTTHSNHSSPSLHHLSVPSPHPRCTPHADQQGEGDEGRGGGTQPCTKGLARTAGVTIPNGCVCSPCPNCWLPASQVQTQSQLACCGGSHDGGQGSKAHSPQPHHQGNGDVPAAPLWKRTRGEGEGDKRLPLLSAPKSWLKLPPLPTDKNDARPPLAALPAPLSSPRVRFRSRVAPAPDTDS